LARFGRNGHIGSLNDVRPGGKDAGRYPGMTAGRVATK